MFEFEFKKLVALFLALITLFTPQFALADYDTTFATFSVKEGEFNTVDMSLNSSLSTNGVNYTIIPDTSMEATIGICETEDCTSWLDKYVCKYTNFANTCTGPTCTSGITNPAPAAGNSGTTYDACYNPAYEQKTTSVMRIHCDVGYQTCSSFALGAYDCCSFFVGISYHLLSPSPPPSPLALCPTSSSECTTFCTDNEYYMGKSWMYSSSSGWTCKCITDSSGSLITPPCTGSSPPPPPPLPPSPSPPSPPPLPPSPSPPPTTTTTTSITPSSGITLNGLLGLISASVVAFALV